MKKPLHYDSSIDPWDLMVANGMAETFAAGNIIKYVFRYQQKEGLADLRKAKWYLDELIKLVEKQ